MPIEKNKKKRISVGLAIFAILLLLLFYTLYTREYVFLTATSADGRYVAELIAKNNLVGGVYAFLLIKDITSHKHYIWGYQQIMKCNLLRGRDSFADIQYEFKGISWNGNTVVLTLNRVHYRGPSTFEIHDLQF